MFTAKPNELRTTHQENPPNLYFPSCIGRRRPPPILIPRNRRMKHRRVSQIGRGNDGVIRVYTTYMLNGQTTFTESEVDPKCWKRLLTPARLRKLELPPPTKAYRATRSYNMREIKGGYAIGCQEISHAHAVALCTAVLEDNGYTVTKA